MIRLTEIKRTKSGDLELIYEDDSDGHFLMGGTFCPNIIRSVIPKDRFPELRKKMAKRTSKSK